MISPTLEVVKAFQSVITKEKEEVEVGAKTNILFIFGRIVRNVFKRYAYLKKEMDIFSRFCFPKISFVT